MADETENEDPSSPEVKALRNELFLLQNILHVMGETGVRGREAGLAVRTIEYIAGLIDLKQNALNSQIATEELGKPMKMEGAKLSLANEAH